MTMQNMSKLQITIRSVSDSPSIRYHINKQVARLLRHSSRIQQCRVVIGAEQKHRHKGKIYGVSIYLTLSGQELICKKHDKNIFIAIRDAFMAIEKNIMRYTKRNIVNIDHYKSHRYYSEIMKNNQPDLTNAS